MKYCERIRALREDSDKTQAEMAALLHVGQKTYSDYELGRIRIPLENMLKLARYYNVSMDYLCGISNLRSEYPKS